MATISSYHKCCGLASVTVQQIDINSMPYQCIYHLDMPTSSSIDECCGTIVVLGIDMSSMFQGAVAFNSPIGAWDVGRVTTTASMFAGNDDSSPTSFNQPLNSWNVGKLTDASWMFWNAWSFDQV